MNLLFLLLPLAAELLDLQMTPEEKRKTGVHKLSDKQKSSLQVWIDNHYEKREAPLEVSLPEKKPKVDQIECRGKETLVHLTDATIWQIKPKDSPKAQSWINPEVGIIVHPSTDTDYPTLLTNTLSGSSVHAVLIKENF